MIVVEVVDNKVKAGDSRIEVAIEDEEGRGATEAIIVDEEKFR